MTGSALIFGAGGQDGHYLTEHCRSLGVDVVGVSRAADAMIQADVASADEVRGLVEQHRPAYVFHLAANSTTRYEALFENHRTISTGTLNVLEAVRTIVPNVRVFLTGSGVQFRNTGDPISEHDAFEAASPYAVARIQSVYAARYYRTRGVRAYVGYLFHHESPRRKPTHISKMLTLAVGRIGEGSVERIELGDIEVEKEWTFAGDVARAIWTLVNQDRILEAAIGTGVTHTIRDWLHECFTLIGRDWRAHVDVKPGFVPEYRRLVSDPQTIRSLGWSPQVGFRELARMMMSTEARVVG